MRLPLLREILIPPRPQPSLGTTTKPFFTSPNRPWNEQRTHTASTILNLSLFWLERPLSSTFSLVKTHRATVSVNHDPVGVLRPHGYTLQTKKSQSLDVTGINILLTTSLPCTVMARVVPSCTPLHQSISGISAQTSPSFVVASTAIGRKGVFDLVLVRQPTWPEFIFLYPACMPSVSWAILSLTTRTKLISNATPTKKRLTLVSESASQQPGVLSSTKIMGRATCVTFYDLIKVTNSLRKEVVQETASHFSLTIPRSTLICRARREPHTLGLSTATQAPP